MHEFERRTWIWHDTSPMEEHCRLNISTEIQKKIEELSRKTGLDLNRILKDVSETGGRKFCYPNGTIVIKLTGKPGTTKNKMDSNRYKSYTSGVRCLGIREGFEGRIQVIKIIELFDESDQQNNMRYRTEISNFSKTKSSDELFGYYDGMPCVDRNDSSIDPGWRNNIYV